MANPKSGKSQKRPPPPPPSRLAPWYPAISAVGAAIVFALLAKAFAPPIHYLSTYNRSQMQDVFLGKGTWAVLCKDGGGDSDAVTKRFGTAARAMKGSVKFGVVDCSGSLPSGKSILQKFELSQDVQPVLFVTGSGMKPVQASARSMETHGALQKWVQGTAEPRASPVVSTRELESKCLKKERCALIMKAGPLEDRAKEAFRELMVRHRDLRFVSVDATKHEASIEKKLGLKPFQGAHQLIYFTRYNVGEKPKVGTPRWGVQVYEGPLETDAMSTFIGDAERAEDKSSSSGKSNNKKITPLTRLPTVMTRKEPKVKPPPPPPRPDPAAGGAAGIGAEGDGSGAAGSSSEGGPGQYEGMNKEELLEQFRAKQAERESERRKAMDAEADNFLFEAVDGVDQEDSGGDADLGWGSGEGGDGGYGDGDGDDGFGDIVDLDEV